MFGVRSAARAGDTFMVTLWPVGTDAAALPAVLGPGAELTAQRGGEEAQQGRTRQRLARRLGFGVLLTALMLWRLPELVQLALAAAVLFGAGAALWRGTWRVLRGGSLGPDAPGLLAALVLFAYSTYAAFTGLRPCFPAPCGIVCALLAGKYAAQLVRGALHAPVRRLRHLRPRTATVVRDGVGTPVDADALTPCDVVRVLPGRACPGRRRRVLRHLHSRCIRPHGAQPGRRKRRWGTQFWPARSTARAAHSSRPRRSATRRRCSGRSQPCSAHRAVRTPEQVRLERAASRLTALLVLLAIGVGVVWLFWRQPGDLARALTCTCAVLAAACPARPGRPRVSPRRQRSAVRPSGASCSRTARRRRPRGRRAPCARCIWLLLAYHTVCLPLAACGVIGPAAAAVLACGASGGVLLCALRGKETKRERP